MQGLTTESLNRKSVKELIFHIRLSKSPDLQAIEKIGYGESPNQVVCIGDMKNVEALKKLAPEVLRRITSWTGNSNGKLDVTTLASPPEESLIQPGMLIHTPPMPSNLLPGWNSKWHSKRHNAFFAHPPHQKPLPELNLIIL